MSDDTVVEMKFDATLVGQDSSGPATLIGDLYVTYQSNGSPTDLIYGSLEISYGNVVLGGDNEQYMGILSEALPAGSGVYNLFCYGGDQNIISFSFSGEFPTTLTNLSYNGYEGIYYESTASVTSSPACYCAGTRIATENGDVAIENLAVGDRVVTASRELQPIAWIGRRKVRPEGHPRPENVQPIRIAASALSTGIPTRDLLVSPEHALWLDDAWVAAKDLVNGATIRREAWAEVEYFHLELDSHDAILAEGTPAESYLDLGSRTSFANAPGGVVALHPDWTPARDPRPFLTPANTERLKARLKARAAELGRSRELAAYSSAEAARLRGPRVNYVRNPRGDGAAPGRIGEKGAAPWFWWLDAPEGVAISVEGVGVESKIPHVDIRFAGRAQKASCCRVYPEAAKAIEAARGEDWTVSCHLRLVEGSFEGVEAWSLYVDEYSAGGDYIDGRAYAIPAPGEDDLAPQRHAITHAMRRAGVGSMTGYLQATLLPGADVDFTLRVGGFQIEAGAWASDLILPRVGKLGPTARAQPPAQPPRGVFETPSRRAVAQT